MGKVKNITERLQKPLQVLAISLSIAGIFLYIIGYAYYWGSLEPFGLSPSELPLQFDGYMAMGFMAVVSVFNKISGNFDWVAILAHFNFSAMVYMGTIITLALLARYIPSLKGKEISLPVKLVKPLEKVAGFFYPVKELIFLPYLIIAGYFILFSIISLLLVLPIMFFITGNNEAKANMAAFSCNEDVAGCTVIKTSKDTWTGIIIANEKDEKRLFDGSKTIHIQKKNIISEKYYMKKVK